MVALVEAVEEIWNRDAAFFSSSKTVNLSGALSSLIFLGLIGGDVKDGSPQSVGGSTSSLGECQ